MNLFPMNISRIQTSDEYRQSFIHFKPQNVRSLHFRNSDIIKDNNPSLVCKIDRKNYILKCVKPRRFHEYFKMLWGRSRLTKEINGNYFLRSIGLMTPDIIDIGYGLIPIKGYRFIGYYIMKNIEESGFYNSDWLIKEHKLSDENRSRFIKNVHDDIKLMLQHHTIFSDLKLKNIHADLSGNTNWIDTGITRYHQLNQKKFKLKFNGTLDRFLKISDKELSLEEKKLFLSLRF